MRGRDGDEVPRILADTLRAHGVSDEQISVIPEEQLSVDAALRRARAGDLLLIFGDQITRPWKQIGHFHPDGALRPVTAEYAIPRAASAEAALDLAVRDLNSLVRDERGVRLARESDD